MDDPAGTTLVADIARDVLREIAPEELPIFEPTCEAYFSNPAAAIKRSKPKDQILGFGMGELGILITPLILHLLSEAVPFLEDIAKKALEDGLKSELTQVVKAMFKKFHSPEANAVSVLTNAQITLIHANVLTAATRLRLPSSKAKLVADAVIAQLVLPKR